MRIPKLVLAVLLAATSCATDTGGDKLARIDNIVVIYAENHSFDNMYGMFPGANGIANARPEQYVQRDHDGTVLPYLRVWGSDGKPDPNFPPLPNEPFRIDAPPINRSIDQRTPGPTHLFYHEQEQINGGRNDMFAAMSSVGGWVMGYYDGSKMRLWRWAQEYTLADNFFMSAFGGSSSITNGWSAPARPSSATRRSACA